MLHQLEYNLLQVMLVTLASITFSLLFLASLAIIAVRMYQRMRSQ